ncbi:MAG: hypothetical protein EA356_16165 [Geminicoccaceae bacterium]|nr:MAG: hypothetical protein EA356_16165 [Geminicoccaceae bacterium]
MGQPSFNDMIRAIIQALATTWRPCQPLLVMAVVIALVISAIFGLLAPGEVGAGLAGLPLMVLTLAVSAGVAGYLMTGEAAYTSLDGVFRENRSYRFVFRYLLLSLGLSLPLVLMIPVLAGAAGGDAVGGGAALTALAMVAAIIYLVARLAVFPYTVFLPEPATLGESWQLTDGYVLRILGCIALFAVGILGFVTLATMALGGVIRGLGAATGLGGGAAATMALQSVGQIAVVYAIDCVYGTITRLLTAPDRPRLLPEDEEA